MTRRGSVKVQNSKWRKSLEGLRLKNSPVVSGLISGQQGPNEAGRTRTPFSCWRSGQR